MKKIYKHIGYYNEPEDMKIYFGLSADNIITSIKLKLGNFHTTEREPERNIVFDTLCHEHDFNSFQQTTDEKYLVRYERGDNNYNDWFIDVYELIEEVEKEITDTDNTITEYCPHCDCEVELQSEFKVQKCPNCGTFIAPCNQCPLLAKNKCISGKCPLEVLANELNNENDNEDIKYTLDEFTTIFNNSSLRDKNVGFHISFTDDNGIDQDLSIYLEEKIEQIILYNSTMGNNAFTWKSHIIKDIPLKDALLNVCGYVPEFIYFA